MTVVFRFSAVVNMAIITNSSKSFMLYTKTFSILYRDIFLKSYIQEFLLLTF